MNNGAADVRSGQTRAIIAALYNASGRAKQWITSAMLKPRKPLTNEQRRKAFDDYWASKPEASN